MTDRDDTEAGASPAWDDPEAGEPVRDLEPRRRWLYLIMVVGVLGIDLVAAALYWNGCAGDDCATEGPGLAVVLGAAAVSVVVIVLAVRQILRPAPTSPGPAIGRGPRASGRTQHGQRTIAGGHAARLADFLDRLERLSTDELRLLAVRPLDGAAHDAARDEAVAAAQYAKRADLVAKTAGAATDLLERAFGTRSYDPTLAGLAWRHEPLRVEDRLRVRDTLADAALAVATEDLVSPATYAELVGPCTMLVDDGEPA